MFDLELAGKLSLRFFSLKKGSLRYPTPRRVLTAFTTIPFLVGLIVINRTFLFLDLLLFPSFRKIKLTKAVFITGVPRSATTYLYSTLASDQRQFTFFRLWELLFAPSIIQKHFFHWLSWIDRRLGRPLYHVSFSWDRLFLSRIARLHKTGLTQPEEDELLLIYAFSSVFLTFLFPDVA